MKHYIITYEEHIWLVYAKNPADAIKKVMSNGFKGKWNDFVVKLEVLQEKLEKL